MTAENRRALVLTILIVAGLVLLPFILGSCMPPTSDNVVRTDEMGIPYGISEYRLDDGTRCAIARVDRGVGITCDW